MFPTLTCFPCFWFFFKPRPSILISVCVCVCLIQTCLLRPRFTSACFHFGPLPSTKTSFWVPLGLSPPGSNPFTQLAHVLEPLLVFDSPFSPPMLTLACPVHPPFSTGLFFFWFPFFFFKWPCVLLSRPLFHPQPLCWLLSTWAPSQPRQVPNWILQPHCLPSLF